MGEYTEEWVARRGNAMQWSEAAAAGEGFGRHIDTLGDINMDAVP